MYHFKRDTKHWTSNIPTTIARKMEKGENLGWIGVSWETAHPTGIHFPNASPYLPDGSVSHIIRWNSVGNSYIGHPLFYSKTRGRGKGEGRRE